MRPKIILLCGLPGSGKTTYRKNLKQIDTSLYDLSSDDFIHEMAGELGQTYEEVFKDSVNLATRLMMRSYERFTNHNVNIIVDRTNLTPKVRAQFSPPGYDRYAVNFFTQYKSVHQIPEHCLEDMRKRWVPATTEEGFCDVQNIF